MATPGAADVARREDAERGGARLMVNQFGNWDFRREEKVEESEEQRERRELWVSGMYERKLAARERADAEVALMRHFDEECDGGGGFRGCLLREEQAAADAQRRLQERQREARLWQIAKAVVASQPRRRGVAAKRRKSSDVGADEKRGRRTAG